MKKFTLWAAILGGGLIAISGLDSISAQSITAGSIVTSGDKQHTIKEVLRPRQLVNRVLPGGLAYNRTSARLRRSYPKPGYTVRQGQRMARKRRNQQRNRAAHK